MRKAPYHPPRWISLDPLDAEKKLKGTALVGARLVEAGADTTASATAT